MVICTLEPVFGSSENLLIPLLANYGGYVSKMTLQLSDPNCKKSVQIA